MRCFSLLSGKIAEGLLLLLLLRDRTTTTEAFSLGNKKARGSAVVPVAAALLRHRSLHSSNQRHLSLRQQRTYEAAASDVEAVAEVTGEESPPLFPDPLERDFVPAEPTIWERLAMLVVGDITNDHNFFAFYRSEALSYRVGIEQGLGWMLMGAVASIHNRGINMFG